jgi:DNA mismatch repair protein MutL
MEQIKTSKKIELLPEHIIDQIKAGEVIERPSTLLKEIIENSIDAGSTKIEIHLINNGLDLISIIDNGMGINSADLPLAFCRHATSKISRFEDIYRLHSYGFRGEALASIASISRVSCETYTKKTQGIIKIDGGETLSHQSEKNDTSKTGTKFFIKDLFFNTPVRMKFIQSKTSEKNQLKKIINAFLLTHPHIEFNIQWDDKDKEFYQIHKEETLRKRIQDVLNKGRETQFMFAENSYDGINFETFITTQSSRGNAHKHYYLFINDRYVQDIQIHKIILNSASGMWPEGETGNYVAFLTIPTDEIDVNIHPNKTVVKLFKAPKAFSVISSSIKHQISTLLQSVEVPSTEVAQGLPLDIQTDSFKDIEYKKVDFNQQSDLSTYFENLHTSNHLNSHKETFELEDPYKVLIDYPKSLLIKFNNTIYFINKVELLKSEIQRELKLEVKSDNIVPLLVSKPLTINKVLSEDFKDSLYSMGFEIDQFDKNTIVLRTFPKSLQQFPYIKIVHEIIMQSKLTINKDEICLSSLEFNEITSNQCIDLIKEISITKLLEAKLITKIEEKDLIKLHEKK